MADIKPGEDAPLPEIEKLAGKMTLTEDEAAAVRGAYEHAIRALERFGDRYAFFIEQHLRRDLRMIVRIP